MAGIRLGKRTKPQAAAPAAAVDANEVARIAYELYEQRGCQPGHDFDDWLQAEIIVRRRHAAQNGAKGS